MSSFLFELLVLVFSCQAIAIASSVQGEKRKLVRSEKATRQQAVAHQDSRSVALELGSSGRLVHSAEASRKDARLQTVGAHDLASSFSDSASIGARQSQQETLPPQLCMGKVCCQQTGFFPILLHACRGSKKEVAMKKCGCVSKVSSHSETFAQAYDAIITELELRQASLADWLSVNCIATKEAELASKQKELQDYKGESDYWWESAWSAIKRTWLNLWFGQADRLLGEEVTLQAELDAMKAEKAQLEKEVADMEKQKKTHIDDANVLLDGLNKQVTALVEDLASYQSDKMKVQTTHDDLKAKMIEEDAAAADVFTELIENLDAAIHEKRDVYYSVTATCGQFEKVNKTECNRCSSDLRACNDICMSKTRTCNQFPGCACDDTIGHDLHQEFNETKTAIEATIEYHEGQIKSHSRLLNQTQKDQDKMQADKEIADRAFDTESARLEALVTQLEKDKSMAEQAKHNATNALASATEENEAAVAELTSDLRNAILALMANKAEAVKSKSALFAAQAVKMKELLETHATTIAGWDAKISAAEAEKTSLQTEAIDLSAALASAV